MNLTVFGATGRTGTPLVGQALEAGHRVTAVVRDRSRLSDVHPSLTVVELSALTPHEIRTVVAGSDAVLSALGSNRLRDARAAVTANLTRAITAVMAAEGVTRFLTFTSGVIAPQPHDQLWWHKHILGPSLATILSPVYAEHRAMEEVCATSGLDWTIFRPARLTGGKLTGSYRTAADINLRGGTSISRADLAQAMIAAIADPLTIGRAISIAY
ncbi:MAG: NAD(P)-dependent oxidoreductase [Mycobacterium sp.]